MASWGLYGLGCGKLKNPSFGDQVGGTLSDLKAVAKQEKDGMSTRSCPFLKNLDMLSRITNQTNCHRPIPFCFISLNL